MSRTALLALAVAALACIGSDSRSGTGELDKTGVRPLPSNGSLFTAGCVGALDTTVSPAGIAGARLWMSESRFRADCGGRDTVARDAPTGYNVLTTGSDDATLIVLFRGDAHPIAEIVMTRSSRFATEAGISVGSTYRELVESYPEQCTAWINGTPYAQARTIPGVLFEIPPSDTTALAQRTFSDTSRVTAVIVNGLAMGCA